MVNVVPWGIERLGRVKEKESGWLLPFPLLGQNGGKGLFPYFLLTGGGEAKCPPGGKVTLNIVLLRQYRGREEAHFLPPPKKGRKEKARKDIRTTTLLLTTNNAFVALGEIGEGGE